MPSPLMVFMYWIHSADNSLKYEKIVVVATNVWNLSPAATSWMNNSILLAHQCLMASIDLMDEKKVWEFPPGAEGERAAHKKMCELYAEELKKHA